MIEALMMGELFDSGEAVFLSAGTHQWLVPEGVTQVSFVVVGPGGQYNVAQKRNIVRCGALEVYAWGGMPGINLSESGAAGGGGAGGDGGGVGGNGGDSSSITGLTGGGGGGGAGYDGNGGNGGTYGATTGTPGTNGGGKGGDAGAKVASGSRSTGERGGGVSIYGPNGGGAYLFGGGLGGSEASTTPKYGGNGGGGLRYANNVPVTPGTFIEVVIDNPRSSPDSLHQNGAVRIIWGAGRKFPIDLVAQSNSKVIYTY